MVPIGFACVYTCKLSTRTCCQRRLMALFFLKELPVLKIYTKYNEAFSGAKTRRSRRLGLVLGTSMHHFGMKYGYLTRGPQRIQPVCFFFSFFFSFFFLHASPFQLLNKPWSQVSSLLPPGPCLRFLSRIGFNSPTARRSFIECS